MRTEALQRPITRRDTFRLALGLAAGAALNHTVPQVSEASSYTIPPSDAGEVPLFQEGNPTPLSHPEGRRNKKGMTAEEIAVEAEARPEVDIPAFKQRIESFTWDEAADPDALQEFKEEVLDAYLNLTRTPRVSREDLIGKNRTNLYYDSASYTEAVRKIDANYYPAASQWGRADFASGRSFLDLEVLRKSTESFGPAGVAITNGIWHEIGHHDVRERFEGLFLNNPDHTIISEYTADAEEWRYYRGGVIYTDTYIGNYRFGEVLNETVVARRLMDQIGIEKQTMVSPTANPGYDENGTDIFVDLTNVANVTVDKLYTLAATSNYEELAKIIGGVLPVEGDPMILGNLLFSEIHQADADGIRALGAKNVVLG